MELSSWITIGGYFISAIVVPLFSGWILRKKRQLKQTEEMLTKVSEGLAILEQTIEEKKTGKRGSGNVIVKAIVKKGPEAKAAVDAAREVVHSLPIEAAREYERRIAELEEKRHAQEMRERGLEQ